MTAPALAVRRFGISALLGVGLGLLYGFLRPLRPRHTLLGDVLFLIGAFFAWLWQGFAVCDADLRLGYMAGLIIGTE